MTDLLVDPEPSSSRRSLVPILLGIIVVVALAIGVVVVLSDGDETKIDDPVSLISSAPDAAREAGTARMTMRADISGDGMSVDMDGEGVVDLVTGATSFEMSMMGMSFEMRMLDGNMYMRLPGAAGLPGGKAWVGMPLPADGSTAGTPVSPNGAGYLEALRGVGADVEELGSREINGVDAVGFRAVIDIETALAQVPAEQRDDLEASVAQMRGAGLDEWPIEVWLTESGLPVRMVMDLASDLFDMSMTMDFTDFGIDADIEAPPAEDTLMVSDQSELESLFGGVPG